MDSQGPTPEPFPNSWLTLASPLDPFRMTEAGKERPYTSLDCINIETQLGYIYGPGSLENEPHALAAAAPSIPAQDDQRQGDQSGPHPRLVSDLGVRQC